MLLLAGAFGHIRRKTVPVIRDGVLPQRWETACPAPFSPMAVRAEADHRTANASDNLIMPTVSTSLLNIMNAHPKHANQKRARRRAPASGPPVRGRPRARRRRCGPECVGDEGVHGRADDGEGLCGLWPMRLGRRGRLDCGWDGGGYHVLLVNTYRSKGSRHVVDGANLACEEREGRTIPNVQHGVGQFGSTRIRKKDANGRRAISWIKDYGSYQWHTRNSRIRATVLGVPDEAPALSPRTPQAKEN
ncbi:hypothetical protein BJ912DRAFT_1105009 [Pholiota molesta]|nr:hypothetical protein BJ912DRAFT_1105009 [Pholiota molesta]